MLCPILEKREVAQNTTEITFEAPHDFSWIAGQTVEITLPSLHFSDTRGSSRIMSIVSAPHEAPHLSIVFRNSPSAWKQTILEMKPGEEVGISKPFGFFSLPENSSRPLFWIAGGVGIAPFMSMLRTIQKSGLPHSPKLLYANNSSEEIAYKKELVSLSPLHHEGKIERIENYDPQSLFYIAGPIGMTVQASKLLEESGVSPQSIFTESFTGC